MGDRNDLNRAAFFGVVDDQIRSEWPELYRIHGETFAAFPKRRRLLS